MVCYVPKFALGFIGTVLWGTKFLLSSLVTFVIKYLQLTNESKKHVPTFTNYSYQFKVKMLNNLKKI